MKIIIDAFYMTEWDDGETILESECKVDLITHEIVSIGKRTIIQSPYSEDTIDDAVDVLDEQYIKFNKNDKELYDVICPDEARSITELGYAPFHIR